MGLLELPDHLAYAAMRTTTCWGVTLCAPDDTHVVEKMVCYNERNALRQGRQWKRQHPDHLVRVFSLMARDTSEPEVLP